MASKVREININRFYLYTVYSWYPTALTHNRQLFYTHSSFHTYFQLRYNLITPPSALGKSFGLFRGKFISNVYQLSSVSGFYQETYFAFYFIGKVAIYILKFMTKIIKKHV